ncbi:MAG: SDR family NAD(P)-dependent oxidoreductase [Pseudomonadota bacterium]
MVAASASTTILITGAAGALGQALVRELTDRDVDCVALDRDLRALNAMHDELAARGRPPLLVPLDLAGAGPDDYAELAEQLDVQLGRLDGLIHAAADFIALQPFEHLPPEDWIKTLQAGLTGPFLLSQCLLPLLAKTPDSRMVWVNDDTDQLRGAYWGAFGVAQAGREALVSILSAECRTKGVDVVGIDPGPFYSPLRSRIWPMEHPAELPTAEQAADPIIELFS